MTFYQRPHTPMRFTSIGLSLAGLSLLVAAGCEPGEPPHEAAAAVTIRPETPPAEIARFLLDKERAAQATDALALGVPTLDRSGAYGIQLEALALQEAAGEVLIGWKMGGSRVTTASPTSDPSFAYMLASDRFEPGAALSPARFVDGEVQVEAEIGFVMGSDVPGPEVSMEVLRASVKEVTGAIELISIRMRALDEGGAAPTINHMIADALSNAGVLLGDVRVPVDSLDLAKEMARAEVNGEIMSSGAGKQILGTTPWDALLWLANELPKHGRMLRAGDIVVTGSLIDNPTIATGDRAEVIFGHLGRIEVSMAAR